MPIARILKKFNINVAFRTRNSLGKCLKQEHICLDVGKSGKYDACGIYKIKCRSCPSVSAKLAEVLKLGSKGT
jgi:hypothetical protein